MSVFMLAALVFSAIFVIVLIFLLRSINKKKTFLSEFISECTLLLVLATLIIGAFQLDVLDKRNKSEFLLDLKNSFYSSNDTNRKIMEALDYGTPKIIQRDLFGRERQLMDTFTDYEIDEYLINFDYINIFIDQGNLDLKQVDQIFGWYVRSAWSNQAIQDYIKRIRKTEPTVYENFESLAKKLK